MRGSSFAVSLTLILLMLRLGSSRTLYKRQGAMCLVTNTTGMSKVQHITPSFLECVCVSACVYLLHPESSWPWTTFAKVVWGCDLVHAYVFKSITTSQTHLRKGQDPSGALRRLEPKRSHRNLHAKSHTKTRVNITTQNAAEMWCT